MDEMITALNSIITTMENYNHTQYSSSTDNTTRMEQLRKVKQIQQRMTQYTTIIYDVY